MRAFDTVNHSLLSKLNRTQKFALFNIFQMTGVIAIRQWDVVSESDDSVKEISFSFISLIDELVAFREVRSLMTCHVLRGLPLVSINLLLYIKQFFSSTDFITHSFQVGPIKQVTGLGCFNLECSTTIMHAYVLLNQQ